MTLRQNIIRLMEEKHLSIRELSILTDISEPTLKNLRTKNSNPTLDILRKLSKSFGVTIDELLKNDKTSIFDYKTQLNSENILNTHEESFMILFMNDVFDFKAGTKAEFKRYNKKYDVTKYIIHKNGKLLEKVDLDRMLFRDDQSAIFFINRKDIIASIQKIIYEVNYA